MSSTRCMAFTKPLSSSQFAELRIASCYEMLFLSPYFCLMLLKFMKRLCMSTFCTLRIEAKRFKFLSTCGSLFRSSSILMV